jgi:hypothetical protein
MIIMFNERQVEIDLSGWGDNGDDITIESAIYTDTGEAVEDKDIDTIYCDFADEIHAEQYINMVSQAYDDWKNTYDR